MLSMNVFIDQKLACSVNGQNVESITAKYRLYPDCISFEVISLANKKDKLWFRKTLSDGAALMIDLKRLDSESRMGNTKLGVPVERFGTLCKKIKLFHNSNLFFEKVINPSSYLELGVIINNTSSVYSLNILHGDDINNKAISDEIELFCDDQIYIKPEE